MKSNGFAIDLETTEIDFQKAKILGIGFSCEREKAIYIPLLINELDMGKRFSSTTQNLEVGLYPYWEGMFQDYVMDKIRKLLLSDISKYMHWGKFDIKEIKHN